MTTKSLKHAEIEKKWIKIDAENAVLGRLSAFIALRLRGKHKPNFTPHMDCGDNIIVVNADKIALTGKKLGKEYYRHTGYPGGIKTTTAKQILESQYAERLLKLSVKRMLPGGPLSRKQMKNLYIYKGPEHPHAGQQPEDLDFATLNRRNKR